MGSKPGFRVYQLSTLDIGIRGDLFVKARDKEEAVKAILEYYRKEIEEAIEDITDDLEEEELKEWKKYKYGEVIEEH